jgi:hypothetical protein
LELAYRVAIIIRGIDGTTVFFTRVSFLERSEEKKVSQMYFYIIHLLLLVNEMSLLEMH